MTNEANTALYFVRHAESEYMEGQERERGLTEQGKGDAATVAGLLHREQIQLFYSSPYRRAVDTIQGLAEVSGGIVVTEEDLRERELSGPEVKHEHFRKAKQRLYDDPAFAYAGGESGEVAVSRAITVIQRILNRHPGQKIVIGTHGDIMTLIFNYYDPSYGYDFWVNTTMPDIYKLEFDRESRLVQVTRLWEEQV
ncbi:histidine phosphatase family protein [Paenibacillus sp. 11B]|uniref:histidine phosphatase family protein n=1 Tax=unclassified Paenibacillus TaxID=185978 RepID=UPI00264DA352|nr:histidine phosphatase family protein [Paenibacillus sp. 11B]MDN8589436.1 histidine phosphatase family protein [Paenibacillus sp. 11B]